jgi:ribosome maturation factor RimP
LAVLVSRVLDGRADALEHASVGFVGEPLLLSFVVGAFGGAACCGFGKSTDRRAFRSARADLLSSNHHISTGFGKWACGPIFCDRSATMAQTHDKERELTREIGRKVEAALPLTEVLAVELTKPDGFTVFIDDPAGVDHSLCKRVTDLLSDYLRDWDIAVSSPGVERPLRKPAHYQGVLGRRVSLRTGAELDGRKRFRGLVTGADDKAVTVGVDGGEFAIPYDAIVRGNLIDEGK